jgi:hypothetical protein
MPLGLGTMSRAGGIWAMRQYYPLMPANGEQGPPDKEQGPPGPPDYKVYRSRPSLLSRLRAPDLATLREHARRSGEAFIAYAETVEGNPILDVTWHGQSYEMPAALFLVQAINHATEHRTQIKTALTQAGITPPELDGWTWNDARRGETR